MLKSLRVLMVSPEIYPYSTVGGLSQVTAFLSKALLKRGHRVEVFTPAYNQKDYFPIAGFPKVNFLNNQKYFGSSIIYGQRKTDFKRFTFLGQALRCFLKKRKGEFDLIHSHDWYGALGFSQIKKDDPKIRTVLTIHSPVSEDYSYKDQKPENFENWTDNLVDFSPRESFLPWRISLAGADLVNTVSPSYSREISSFFGINNLPGIINGVENAEFALTKEKKESKMTLQKDYDLPVIDVPLFAFAGRIVKQKGITILVEALRNIFKEKEVQFVCLGEGDRRLMNSLFGLQKQFPKKVGLFLHKDFSRPKAIFAGADFFVLPSIVEPCGIAVIEAMKMGAIPVVRETGGLKDLVKADKNGLSFKDYRVLSLEKALREAIKIYSYPRAFLDLRTSTQKNNFTWEKAALVYEQFYLQ